MKIKTADLIGPALDWAVAKCEGYNCLFDDEVCGPWLVPQEGYLHDEKPLHRYTPSTDWSQGGPRIASGKINIKANLARMPERPEYDWLADCPEKGLCVSFNGPTPLIAAMRCYCCAKLGDEIEIPQELQLCQQPNL